MKKRHVTGQKVQNFDSEGGGKFDGKESNSLEKKDKIGGDAGRGSI